MNVKKEATHTAITDTVRSPILSMDKINRTLW